MLWTLLLHSPGWSLWAQVTPKPPLPLSDTPEHAVALLKSIDLNACDIDIAKDLTAASEALRIFRGLHDAAGEAGALLTIGDLYYSSGEFTRSLRSLNRALASARQQGDRRAEARTQLILAHVFQKLGRPQSALQAGTQALDRNTQLADDSGSAASLLALGELYEYQDPATATAKFEQAMKLSIASGDRRTQEAAFNDQGDMAVTSGSGDAFALYQSAFDIENQTGDCRNKAATLANLASHDEDIGRPQAALDLYTQAVEIERRLGDRDAEAEIRNAEAKEYEDLGDFASANSALQQSLQMERSLGSRQDEGMTIRSLGDNYLGQNKFTQALKQYRQALPILRQTQNVSAEIVVINNLGWIYANLRSPQTARVYYNRAAAMAQKSDDQFAAGYASWGIGQLEQSDALESYLKALHIFQATNQTEFEGLVDASLMMHFRSQHQPGVAIFFGKQAIEHLQEIRRNMSGLSQALQQSFLEAKADPYRNLAQLLIDEGRLYEAQQILDLMKLQEFSDYIRGPKTDLTASPSRTAAESKFEAQYQKDTENIIALENKLQQLKLKLPESKTEYDQAKSALSKERGEFEDYLHQLYLGLKAAGKTEPDRRDLDEHASNIQDAISRRPNTVGIYTLMGEDKLRLIVITSTNMVWRSYPISKKLLEKQCASFLNLLRLPKQDPATAATELFKILFGPIQKDIEQSGAHTLVWYLDGTLRYLPMSTLRNPASGKYLVETYNMVSYTPINYYLTDVPSLADVTGIAMGTSRSYDDALGGLPNVKNELNQIVTDPAFPQSQGPLQGTILLDSAFTQTAMEQKIGTQSVVHIASHFVLTPGNPEKSYLLLGGKDSDKAGYHLSVPDIVADDDLQLKGKELVTLSACQTAAGTRGSDGFEAESVSQVVLKKKAKAVISSLWEVNDQSTGALMAGFYKQWIGSNGTLTKAEALRKAQLDLLEGKTLPQPNFSNPDAPTSYSHPYYWAPFVLMGNWQ